MARMPPGLCATLAVLIIAPVLLSGCHHGLEPAPVVYPTPPPPICNVPLRCDACAPPKGPPKTPATKPAERMPIDLITALRLADGQNPDIALARERIREALARQAYAEAQWFPSLELGSTWLRHDGQIQRSVGDVFTTSRSALFAGGGPALNLPLGDALFLPLAARQITQARRAGAAGVANELLLQVALAYQDLLQAHLDVRINEETIRNARELFKFTESYEKRGKGAAADTARARTEVARRERERIELEGRIAVASARLVQLLQFDPAVQLRPVEDIVAPVVLVPEEVPLADLILQALGQRPELAEQRAVINATLEAWRAARVAPWVPSLRLAFAAGGFGGGINDFFGNFNGRSDFAATVVWTLQNFGLGNQALMRERRSQYAQATFRQASVEAQVAAQVASAFSVAFAHRQALAAAQREVADARESYRLNDDRVRRFPDQGRPIELLQAIQALAVARRDYLQVVSDYNRAQFHLFTALGHPPLCAFNQAERLPTTEPVVPAPPPGEAQVLPALRPTVASGNGTGGH